MSREWKPGQGVPNSTFVIIDFSERLQVARLVALFQEAPGSTLDAMQAALREFANPKPPKPDEPTGRYAVVVDSEGNEWLRGPSGAWCEQHTGDRAGKQPHFRMLPYERITVVRVLSEGVQP